MTTATRSAGSGCPGLNQSRRELRTKWGCCGELVMPSNGLSLVGFLTDQQQALNHLKAHCMPGTKTDVELIADWQAAQTQLATTTAKAGNPDVQPIPASYQAHVQQLSQQ